MQCAIRNRYFAAALSAQCPDEFVFALFLDGVEFLKSVEQSKVKYNLALADYGILLRDNNTTNRVASPSKFAEYLAAGLKVIISENIGDLSEFVTSNDCGYIIDQININDLRPLSQNERLFNISLAEKHFLRESQINIHKYNEALKNE